LDLPKVLRRGKLFEITSSKLERGESVGRVIKTKKIAVLTDPSKTRSNVYDCILLRIHPPPLMVAWHHTFVPILGLLGPMYFLNSGLYTFSKQFYMNQI